MTTTEIFTAASILIASISLLISVFKTKPEITAQQAKTIADYQDILDQEIAKAKLERQEARTQMGNMSLEITIIKAELARQTARGDNWQRQAEAAAQRITTLETVVRRISVWAQKWDEKIRAAGIEPVPMEE
jgi:phage shock protein A